MKFFPLGDYSKTSESGDT
uniref:Uncharacterized protein n=1 Tax=Arundo donax TaxID=35708 RepID=A0A0A9H2Y6_ARUDO